MPTATRPGNFPPQPRRKPDRAPPPCRGSTRRRRAPSQASTVGEITDAAAELRGMPTAAVWPRPPRHWPGRPERRRRDRRCAATRILRLAKVLAWAAGSSSNTVAWAMSPCRRRTQRPSLRSIAGNRITAASQEIGDQRRGRAPGSSRGGIGCPPMLSLATVAVTGPPWSVLCDEVARPRRASGRNARNRHANPPCWSGFPQDRMLAVATSVFHPICGIFTEPSAGSIRRLRRRSSRGPDDPVFEAARGQELHADADAEERLARRRHASSSASVMPLMARRPCAQSAKAPTPGNTIRSARRTAPDRPSPRPGRVPVSRAARSNALRAECRLPEP